jgi:large subunit ribosomal protein L24
MRRTSNLIPKLHIKKDDNVKVLSGNDKGKTGRVLEVLPKERKVIVDGINMVTKHSKPTTQNPNGGRIQMAAAIHISKVMLVDPKTNTPTRVGRKTNAEGTLVRYAKRSGEELK